MKVAVASPPPSPPPEAAAEAAPLVPAAEPPKVVGVGDVTLSGNKVNLPGEIEFATGSAKIQDTARNKEILAQLLAFLKQNDKVTRVRIEGHTDAVGAKPKNAKLSNARAAAVVQWLAAQGVETSRLHPAGFGPDKPIADNTTAEGRAKNRRTEFHLEEIEGKPADEVNPEPVAAAPAPPPAAAPAPAPAAAPALANNAPPAPGKSIDWNAMFFGNGAQPYTRFGVTTTFTCPAAPPGKPLGKVEGGTADDYGPLSRLCAAAVHAGKITSAGGSFTVAAKEVSASYKGASANGISGENAKGFGSFGFGFTLPTSLPTLRWKEDKLRNVFEVLPSIGETKSFVCAPATDADKKRAGEVIGSSDDYGEWSQVCWAAVHAGKITLEKGGTVTFVVKKGAEKGSKEYKGSSANGVVSKDAKNGDRFSFGLR